MRLDNETRDIIKNEVSRLLGEEAIVRLFGSRVDDTQRGGDIDLLIDMPVPLPRRVAVECQIAASLFIKLGGRKVDVLIRESGKSVLPIHEEAIRLGVIL